MLLLPLLIPTVVVPALMPVATAGLVIVDENAPTAGEARAGGAGGAERDAGGPDAGAANDQGADAGEPDAGAGASETPSPTTRYQSNA